MSEWLERNDWTLFVRGGGGKGGRGEGGEGGVEGGKGGWKGGRGGGRGKERRPREEGNIKNWVGGRERLGYGKGWREEREMAVISLKGIKDEKKNSIPFELFTFHRERKS